MSYDFDTCLPHVQACVLGVTDDAGLINRDLEGQLRLHYRSRLFFISKFDYLFSKCNTIANLINRHDVLPANDRPSLPDWTAASARRAVSLSTAMRLKSALERIAASGHAPTIRCITLPNGSLLSIERNDIVPSVYYADARKLRVVRDSLGLTRRDLSKVAVGKTELAGYLEDGDRNKRFRVTLATAARVYTALEEASAKSTYAHSIEPFDALFGYDYDLNANCVALKREWGNVI